MQSVSDVIKKITNAQAALLAAQIAHGEVCATCHVPVGTAFGCDEVKHAA